MQYRETTATKMLTGQWGAAMNYVETHKPIVIKNRDHRDIIMLLATDYEDVRLKCEALERDKNKLHEALGYLIDGNHSHDLTCQIGMPEEFCQGIIDLWHSAKPITHKED